MVTVVDKCMSVSIGVDRILRHVSVDNNPLILFFTSHFLLKS